MTIRLPSSCTPGERGSLVSDALLDVAVGDDRVDEVVERRLARCGVGVEQAALAARGHRHADSVAEALAERPRGGLDALCQPVLGVAGGDRSPGAEGLQVVEPHPVPGQVQLDVQRQAASGRRTARTGPGPATSGPRGHAGAPAGRAGRQRGRGSSRSPGARCRPSARRPSPGHGPGRRPACRRASSQGRGCSPLCHGSLLQTSLASAAAGGNIWSARRTRAGEVPRGHHATKQSLSRPAPGGTPGGDRFHKVHYIFGLDHLPFPV